MSNINPVEATNTAELHPQGFSRMKPTADLIGVSVQSIKRWYNAGKFVKPVAYKAMPQKVMLRLSRRRLILMQHALM